MCLHTNICFCYVHKYIGGYVFGCIDADRVEQSRLPAAHGASAGLCFCFLARRRVCEPKPQLYNVTLKTYTYVYMCMHRAFVKSIRDPL
jgi:hypothetical protein